MNIVKVFYFDRYGRENAYSMDVKNYKKYIHELMEEHIGEQMYVTYNGSSKKLCYYNIDTLLGDLK